MIRAKLQTTLDAALHPNVLSYWQRKTGADANEYIVYTQSGDNREDYADNKPMTKSATAVVRYYYRSELANTHTGRTAIEARETAIETALETAGFIIPGGKFDVGDVDDIGYNVTVFEIELWRVV